MELHYTTSMKFSSCIHLMFVLLAGTSCAGLSLLFHSSMRDYKTNATCTAFSRSWSQLPPYVAEFCYASSGT